MKTLETDYAIIGSGAVGMAFADELLLQSDDTNIIIIDRFAKPGGHWNVAYPFVTLHQPSTFYGVSSKELSQGLRDKVGLNKGLGDLASGSAILAYFDDVMRHTFLPSGRVQYFPLCSVEGPLDTENAQNGLVAFKHNLTGETYQVKTWIKSRDAWLLNRENTQPTEDFFFKTMETQAAQFEAFAQAADKDDMFDRLKDCGYFLQLDPNVRPTMFHGATISPAELKELQRVKNIIRKGRVTHIDLNEITLREGTIPTSPNHIHIDCSASAITEATIKPVFEGRLITPQTVRSYQPVFSAAFIAMIERSFETEAEKNKFTKVVPLPDTENDFLHMTVGFMMNQYLWGQTPVIRDWMKQNRLVMKRLRNNAMPAAMKLNQFIAAL